MLCVCPPISHTPSSLFSLLVYLMKLFCVLFFLLFYFKPLITNLLIQLFRDNIIRKLEKQRSRSNENRKNFESKYFLNKLLQKLKTNFLQSHILLCYDKKSMANYGYLLFIRKVLLFELQQFLQYLSLC